MPRGHNDFAAAVDARVQRICAGAQHSQGNHDDQHETARYPVAACAEQQSKCAEDGSGHCRKRRIQADREEQSNARANRSRPICRWPLP